MARDPLKVKSVTVGRPTDTNKMHGNIANPPRMMEMGGASALHRPGGPHKNKLTIKKPGGTR